MKILIVDDDEIALDILSAALESSGYEVETASNGIAALARIEQGDIRFVITDWEMPQMNGLALCQSIRRKAASGYVYIVLLTSYGTSQEIVEGMSAGADDFVVKPFNHAELTARVRAGERVLALETRDTLIFALAKLAESRDQETGMHLERVQRYSRRLAESLINYQDDNTQVDTDFIRLVYQTSPLHDIGKVGVPDCVLQKPGKLTKEEFDVMKTHTTIGAQTLEAALANYPHARFLQVARDIAKSHHERWDGKGYPEGLAGTAIPLAARIVAVADVYDALTSRRVYKEAFSHKVAYDIITSDSGKHFDPRVVTAFVELEADFLDIRSRFGDDETHPTGKNTDSQNLHLADQQPAGPLRPAGPGLVSIDAGIPPIVGSHA
jgi:putative two-component system response regulator